MKPITRKEYYLSKAAGTYTGPTPPPVLREDYYLATLAGDYSGNCPAPVTRLEKYMSAAAGITSYVPQPVTRIEKYWYAIAKGMGYVPEPVTREEQLLYAIIHKEPQYIDKTAEGSLILLTDSVQAPLTSLTLYGHSTQDGTPSPENPVPIVSAGDEGEINVTMGGKNLIPFPYIDHDKTEKGITFTVQDDHGIKIQGTATGDAYFHLCHKDFGETSGSNTYGPVLLDGYVISDKFTANTPSKTYMNYNGTNHALIIVVLSGETVDVTIYPQVEYGTVATAYEPYKTPQTLSLSTPGGLPGIPVSSGGNYTDESGQQWVCDEIDLARGKYVQRIGKTVVDGTEIKFTADSTGGYWNLPRQSAPGISVQEIAISKYFPIGVFLGNARHSFLFTTPTLMSPYFSLVDELNAFCAEKYADGQPIEIYYIMAPSETDLTAEEIAAYKALHTYSPTTTVTNDADAWMKVGYKANT